MKKLSSFVITALIAASASFAQDANPIVLIKTDFGDIKCELYNETPGHRDNFIVTRDPSTPCKYPCSSSFISKEIWYFWHSCCPHSVHNECNSMIFK